MPIIKRTYIILSVAILCAIAGLLVMTIQYNQLFNDASAWVNHTIAVIEEEGQALSSLHSYELGKTDLHVLDGHLHVLRRLTADNPKQQSRLDTLMHLVSGQRENRGPAINSLVQRPAIEPIRDLILRMEDEEDRLLLDRQAANARSHRLLRDASLTLLILVFTLLCVSAILILYNLSRRKKAERALRDAQDQTMQALHREQELNALKSRFVALASHEFKTPLSVILSSANLIGRYNDPSMTDQRNRHIQRIRSNVSNLKALLNDFLSLERLEQGAIRNVPVLSDLVEIARETIRDMEDTCKEGQHTDLDINGDRRLVPVDEHLLRNVLNNLISNAIKYSPEKSPIRLALEFGEESIHIYVADKGIGIPTDEQEHLFERFFRASNTGGISGTGLGLSIVKKYLDLMNGSITVHSSPATGTTFTVILPAPPAHLHPNQSYAPEQVPL